MNKLELKHLAAYLPYDLEVMSNLNMKGFLSFNYDEKHHYSKLTIGYVLKEQLKPILKPLSDLDKEMECNGKKFIPIEYFVDSENPSIQDDIYNTLSADKEPYYINYGHAKKLLEWHFDIFGLIEKGLAVDKNTL